MTQAQAAPAPSAAPAPVASRTPTPTPAHAGSPKPEDVPSLLNRWQAIAVTVCIIFGALAAVLQFLGWQANGRAADNTEQLVRVQQIQSTLVRADALATNAFLRGGLEPVEQRAEYDAAVDQVVRQIADAAEAQPADRQALSDLSAAVVVYATEIAQARANNRQGFPVGASYLRDAGDSLRADAGPILEALVAANAQRAEDEMDGHSPLLLLLAGAVSVVILWWVNRQLARRFRRRFNVGIAAAAVGIAAVTLVAMIFALDQDGDNEEILDGSYRLAVSESSARTAANNAKSFESLRLIARGSGDTFEEPWIDQAATVDGSVSRLTSDLWLAYVDQHAAIVELDTVGDWDEAVALATSPAPTASTATFNAFDQASQQVIETAGAETTESLRSGGFGAVLLLVVTLLVGLAAAAASTWGVNQRRREYS